MVKTTDIFYSAKLKPFWLSLTSYSPQFLPPSSSSKLFTWLCRYEFSFLDAGCASSTIGAEALGMKHYYCAHSVFSATVTIKFDEYQCNILPLINLPGIEHSTFSRNDACIGYKCRILTCLYKSPSIRQLCIYHVCNRQKLTKLFVILPWNWLSKNNHKQ